MPSYFTDREYGERPRTGDAINTRLWAALVSVIVTRLSDGSFGYSFPEQCPDGDAACGCDDHAFGNVLQGEVPWIEWPLSTEQVPATPVVLDVLEFCAASVGQPIEGTYHSFYRHHHLSWDREAGLHRFLQAINLLFARNGVAFELSPTGQARRLLPQPLAKTLAWTLFSTGEEETDRLLESARLRFASPKPEDRQDAVEKLWDAFERLKTLEPGRDKKAQAEALLDRAAPPGSRLRQVLGEEAMALTSIGNNFRIRHSETDRDLLTATEQVDYLFARMFAFIRIVLKATGRGG
jgi:hypothetical protein